MPLLFDMDQRGKKSVHPYNDRFIPSRSALNENYCRYALATKNEKLQGITPSAIPNGQSHRDLLFANLIASDTGNKRILRFNQFPIRDPHQSSSMKTYSIHTTKVQTRQISLTPTRILDAPNLRDDYYLNLLSWGSSNILAVALDKHVYLYNVETTCITALHVANASEYVTSVTWLGEKTLAIGTSSADLQIWDATTTKLIRTIHSHTDRIGSLAWNVASQSLASGSRDTKIVQHDIKAAQSTIVMMGGHAQEICGLSWSHDGKTLASGGNDNRLCLWDSHATSSARLTLIEHTAAVKALAWCPWDRHILASGGGTADRCIKLWYSSSGNLQQNIHTGSQVCGLLWSPNEKELLSSHGFSQNELCLWSVPRMNRIKEFTGHTARVLHMAMSPDGRSVVSAAADETLRFWNVFASTKTSQTPRFSSNPNHLQGIR